MQLNIDKSSWKKVRLGDVAFEYSRRINNPKESELERFVGSSNIGQWDFRVKSWESTESVSSAMKLFEPDDYLLVRRSLYASDFRERAPRAHFAGVCSGDILTIRENPEFIADGFLIGILNSPDLWKYVVANASGSITRRIKWRDLANYEFLLPPKAQQAELADLLWAMDNMIEKDLEVLERLEDYIKASEKSIIKDSKTLKLKNVIELNYGKALKDSDRIDGPYKVVSSSGVQGTHNLYLSKGPGIVVGRKGNAGEIFWIDNDFWTIDTAYYVTLKNEFLNYPLKGIYYLLKSVGFKKDLIATAVPGLNRDDALNNKINVPSVSELNIYVEKLDKLNELFLNLESKLQSSKALQKALINQVF